MEEQSDKASCTKLIFLKISFLSLMAAIQTQAKLNKDNGEHKQRVVMYVTLNGIRIMDEKTQVRVPNQHEVSSLLSKYTQLFPIEDGELFLQYICFVMY